MELIDLSVFYRTQRDLSIATIFTQRIVIARLLCYCGERIKYLDYNSLLIYDSVVYVNTLS